MDILALWVQRTKAFIKAVVRRVTFKLILIVDELLSEITEDRHPPLLLDQRHQIKWLSEIERRGNLHGGEKRVMREEGQRERDKEGMVMRWEGERERERERERGEEMGGREREREKRRGMPKDYCRLFLYR